jgi:hypothetical protein
MEPPGMSTNPNSPETPARNLTNGELELARRRAAAEEIAQRIAAFKRVASAPAEAPGSDGPSIPDGNPAPQDALVPQAPERQQPEPDTSTLDLTAADMVVPEPTADMPTADLPTPEVLGEVLGRDAHAEQPAAAAPARSRLLEPATPKSSVASAGEQVAPPNPRPAESRHAAGPGRGDQARGDRHPFVHAYAISQAARRQQADAPAARGAAHARPLAGRAPDERSREGPRQDIGESRRPALYGSEFSALMRARDAERAEAAWALADTVKAEAARAEAVRADRGRIDAARANAAEARAARLDAARRREMGRDEARRDETAADDSLAAEPLPSELLAGETLADQSPAHEARTQTMPPDGIASDKSWSDKTWPDKTWPDDASSEPQWAPIADAAHAPARRWPRRVAGLVGITAIAAAAVGATFVWQLRSGGPGSQPSILAASERAADKLAEMLTSAPQPDAPNESILAAGEAMPAPDPTAIPEPTPELAAIAESPIEEAPANHTPATETPATATSVTEAPASPPSESATPEIPIIARAPSANHPPATRPGASRPAATLSQLPDSEAIGDAPIVPPPTPEASEQAAAPEPVTTAEPKPEVAAALKPAAAPAAAAAEDAASPEPAASEPVAKPVAKPIYKPAKPAAKPAKQTKASRTTPGPIKEVLNLLAPFMNGSKPQQPQQGNRK